MPTDLQEPTLASLAPRVYAVLDDVFGDCGEGSYTAALRRVLAAAQLSERNGVALSALPMLACMVAGGPPAEALPVAAAWRGLHIAAKLLDDVQDGDLAHLSASLQDQGQVINLATGFIAGAALALTRLPPPVCQALQRGWHGTILTMAAGQHVDLQRPRELSLEEYFQLIDAKSGSFFALAARSGAVCAGSGAAVTGALSEFGRLVGVLVQLIDDFVDWRRPPGGGGPACDQRTLPVYYALAVASPGEKARLVGWLAEAATCPEAAWAARRLVEDLGAELYMRAEIVSCREQAYSVLRGCYPEPTATRPLEDWLGTLLGNFGAAWLQPAT